MDMYDQVDKMLEHDLNMIDLLHPTNNEALKNNVLN